MDALRSGTAGSQDESRCSAIHGMEEKNGLVCLCGLLFGGMFLVNAVPHFVAGVMGRRFPSPFASPPGKGESSPMVNVLWGAFNLVIGYLLVFRVGDFLIRDIWGVLALGIGGLVMAVMLAWNFGKIYGGK